MTADAPSAISARVTILTRRPDLVAIPPGTFVMGAGADEKFATDTERPPHRVSFGHRFALGRHPVTVAEYRLYAPNHDAGAPGPWPVVNVSWDDAIGYCNWLSELHGHPLRLPTEAEWEFACRGGTGSPFYTGSDLAVAQANFLYHETGERIGCGSRTAVGSYPANPFGLHDMLGNVGEWVGDAWHRDYHGAPADGSAWVAPADSRRVVRGGAWDHLPRMLRSASRDGLPATTRRDNIGFRLAITLEN